MPHELSIPPRDVAPDPRLPDRIGPYRIVGVLGRGGMGVVFDAISPDGAKIALKIVQSAGESGALGDDRKDSVIARFQREARILGELDPHPSVVRLVDAGEAGGQLYLAMERIEGVSLLTLRRRGPLEREPLIELGMHLSDALRHLHAAGVVHRDIKPANVLVRPDGRPVITDFGISGMSQATGITQHGDLLGSPGFMAPEIVAGAAPTPASDQYALGRVLFELGARGPAPKLSTGVPILEVLQRALEIEWPRFPSEGRWPELARVLGRMLEPDPKDRYPTADAVRRALAEVSESDALAPETVNAFVERLDLTSEHAWGEGEAKDEEGSLVDLELPAGERRTGVFAPPPLLPTAYLAPLDDHAPMDAGEPGVEHPKNDDSRTVLEPLSRVSAGPNRRRLRLPPARSVTYVPAPAPVPEHPEPAEEAASSDDTSNESAVFVPVHEPIHPGEGLVDPAEMDRTAPTGLPAAVRPSEGLGRSARSAPGLLDAETTGRARAPVPSRRAVETADDRSALSADAPARERVPEEGALSPPRPAGGRTVHLSAEARGLLSEERVVILEGQIRRLKEDLETARARADARPQLPLRALAGVAGVALALGIGLGLAFPTADKTPIEVILTPLVGSAADAAPPMPTRERRLPTPQEIADGRVFLMDAQRKLAAGDLEGADRDLGLCAELADLPACHRLRGSLRALIGDPRARASLERYLEVAPPSEARERVRAQLRGAP